MYESAGSVVNGLDYRWMVADLDGVIKALCLEIVNMLSLNYARGVGNLCSSFLRFCNCHNLIDGNVFDYLSYAAWPDDFDFFDFIAFAKSEFEVNAVH